MLSQPVWPRGIVRRLQERLADTPVVLLNNRRQAWARSYLNAILQRDVQDIASVDKLQRLAQLLTALAQVCGQLSNYTQLGARIGLDGKTVTRYITLLEQLFLVRRVPAWSANALARVVKTPKLQFLVPGLLSALLGLRLAGLVSNRTAFGPALECYVYAELLRLASWSEESYELFMYRDKDQLEVDVVIANGLGQTLPMGSLAGRPLWALPLASLWNTAPPV